MTPQPTEQQDLRAYLRIIWRWKWLLLACLVIAPAIAYAVESRKTDTYQSSTLIQLQGIQLDPSIFGGQQVSGGDLLTVARLIQTTPIANAAGKLLHPPASGASLLGEVSVSPDQDTNFLTISATDADPRRAADIANAFATALSGHQAAVAIGQLNFAIGNIKRQLAARAPTDTTTRNQLVDQLQRLRASRAAQGHSTAVIERATPSSTPVGKNVRRSIELGLVIGLLLGLGAVVLAENSDRRLRTSEDLEDLTGLPLLSAIPASAFALGNDGDPRQDEAFKRLRGALTYFNVDRRMTTVLVASPGQEDGKTTVAVGLSVALARAGKRVVLVEADLRRPQIASRLAIDSHADGLASVLVGEQSLHSALVDQPLELDLPGEAVAGGRLLVLPSGPPPPNPSELLGSQEMQRIVRDLETQADVVVIDTPAALAVADALPLLQAASGVVIVARLDRTTRAAVRRLQRLIATAGGTALGVVATGTASREGYGGYGYGYYDARDGGRRGLFRRRGRRRNRQAPSAREVAPDGSVATPVESHQA